MAATALHRALEFSWRRRLPMILQVEASECALACVAMIARFHGHQIDLHSLRRRFATSVNGVTLARVIEVAAGLNLRARALQVEPEDLRHLKTPCILHWDLNHFVVLKAVTRNSVIVHDPARGVRRLTRSELSKHLTGIALEMDAGPAFKPVKEGDQKISVRALTGGARGLGGALVQLFVLALCLEVFALTGPLYMQWVLDQALVSADKNLLSLLGIGFGMLVVFQAAIGAVRAWTVTWLSARLGVEWVGNLFAHLLRLPLDWFVKRHVGDVVSRFSSIQAIQKTITTSFVTAILDGAMAAFTIVILSLYSVKLTLIVLGSFLAYSILRWASFGPFRRAKDAQIVYGARQQSELLEAIRGAQTLKLHNQQGPRSARYSNTIVETTNRDIATQRLTIAFTVASQLIFGIQRVGLIWVAANMVLEGQFTVGMLVAFIAYSEQFTSRASSLINLGIEFWMLGLHADRVADIALTAAEANLESTFVGPPAGASIELRDIFFRYSEDDRWILNGCSLYLKAGESVVIEGPSGGGKTTLVKVLLGLLEPERGEVLFGGIDIRKMGLASYRAQVGAVMQDDHLFAGSFADNISFFDAEATFPKIEAAAKLASIHEVIMDMPMGYETLIGDMGSSLSGGQKQRLILARALYRGPQLLVLDEATSHLDVELERKINSTVGDLAITRVIIAHSAETISTAQRVLIMSNGTLHTVPNAQKAEKDLDIF